MSAWIFYLLTVMANLGQVIPAAIAFGCVCTGVVAFIWLMGAVTGDIRDSTLNLFQTWIKRGIGFIVLLGIVSVLVPSPKQMAFIFAGTYVTNSEAMKQIPPKALEYMNLYLDRNMKDLKDEIVKEGTATAKQAVSDELKGK